MMNHLFANDDEPSVVKKNVECIDLQGFTFVARLNGNTYIIHVCFFQTFFPCSFLSADRWLSKTSSCTICGASRLALTLRNRKKQSLLQNFDC